MNRRVLRRSEKIEKLFIRAFVIFGIRISDDLDTVDNAVFFAFFARKIPGRDLIENTGEIGIVFGSSDKLTVDKKTVRLADIFLIAVIKRFGDLLSVGKLIFFNNNKAERRDRFHHILAFAGRIDPVFDGCTDIVKRLLIRDIRDMLVSETNVKRD